MKDAFDFHRDVGKIGGWLTKREGEYLYNTAKELPKGSRIIEIGSWKGRSTVCLGKGSISGNNVIITAIDPHVGSSEHQKLFGKVDTYADFLKNIRDAHVEGVIDARKSTSEEVANEYSYPVDFVFVDGAHEYRFVKKDFECWFPMLKNGGLIAFHDSWHGVWVHLFTLKLLFFSSQVKNPRLIDNLTVFEKTESAPIGDRLYNIVFFLYRLFAGFIGFIRIWNFQSDRTKA